MKHFTKILYLLLAVIFIINDGISQNIKSYSNEFLAIGVGARSHGMGGAMVASVNDINAGYWNPAGLARMTSPFQVGAMHAEWFAGIVKYDHLSVVKQFNAEKNAYGGISIIRMGVDNIPNTLQLREPDGSINYDKITTFAVADYAMLAHYAQRLGDSKWNAGGSLKIIHRSIGSFSKAWGFGLDFGLQYVNNRFSFGIMGRDITTTYNAWKHTISEEDRKVLNDTGNSVPKSSIEITTPSIIPGIAYLFNLGENYTLLTALDARFTTDGQRNVLVSSKYFNMDPAIGFEAFYKDIVGLRAGLNNAQKFIDNFGVEARERYSVQPNFGLALKLGNFYIDYAITNLGNSSVGQLSHIFSLKVDIFPKVRS